MPFISIWLKIKTNLIKLVLNTFISIKGPIILQNCPILSPSEPDQLSLQLNDAIHGLQFYSNSLIHILSLSNLHNSVASIQKNRGDKSHRVIVALGFIVPILLY